MISDSRLFADSYSKADEKCTEKNGYSLISETNATSQCGNSYIKHIEERLGKKIKIWVNSSESGPSCLPKNSSCDSNDTVILCENFDIKAGKSHITEASKKRTIYQVTRINFNLIPNKKNGAYNLPVIYCVYLSLEFVLVCT